MPGLP